MIIEKPTVEKMVSKILSVPKREGHNNPLLNLNLSHINPVSQSQSHSSQKHLHITFPATPLKVIGMVSLYLGFILVVCRPMLFRRVREIAKSD